MQLSFFQKSEQESQFLKVLEHLNDEQRVAVDQTEGPVMVLAGPGTGKTQLIAARIGNILYKTDAQAQNILCLTYTEAGVTAMRERLKKFIGSSANQLHIHTFHSYCHHLIQNNYKYFGQANLEPLDDLERIEIIRSIIDELPIDNILKQANLAYINERKISNFIRMMKAETWAKEDVLEAIGEYLSDLPSRPEYQYKRKYKQFSPGDPKEAKIEEEALKMEKLKASADLLKVYQKKLRQANRYDFEDMILWVTKAFVDHPELLQLQQEEYLYILVDEFQDTNGAQFDLLEFLISFWEDPNIFVVGDDDQSIFEFQGARLSNTKNFIEKYRDSLTLIMLKNNYRSSSNILASAAKLIDHNDDRLTKKLDFDISKDLIASNPEVADLKVKPSLKIYKNKFQEQISIVNEIEAAHAAKADLSKIAIIYAKHQQIQIIEDLLLKRDIPFQTRKKKDILNHFLIEEIIHLLKYIEKESNQSLKGDFYLIKILHFEVIGVNPADLSKLQFYQTKKREERLSWRELIADQDLLKSIGVLELDKFKRISETLNELVLLAGRIAVPEMVQKLLNAMGILPYAVQHENKKEYLQILRTFVEYIKAQALKDKKLNLKNFIARIDKMIEMSVRIPMSKVYGDINGVNLVTAHSSKGLEYETVYIIDCIKSKWEPAKVNFHSFKLPDTLTQSEEDALMESRRRLFYVAMTRAKKNLFMSYALLDDKEKTQQNTRFIDELIESELIDIEEVETAEDDTTLALFESMQVPPNLRIHENVDIDQLLSNFEMSPSALNAYLACPLRFYYEQLLKVPSLSSEAATYGTAMHNALWHFFDKRNQEKELKPEDLIEYFYTELDNYASNFSDAGYKFRKEKGARVLGMLFDQQSSTWPEKVELEFPLRNVKYKDVLLKGFIDRLDILAEDKAVIVDYKTGSNPQKKLSKPTARNPYGGDYWRQLIFYKILCDNSNYSKYNISEAAIAALEPDAKSQLKNYSINIRPEDVSLVGDLIEETWEKIKNKEFSKGCGKPTCDWCMLIQNHASEAHRAPEIRED